MPPFESCEAAGALAWVSGVDSIAVVTRYLLLQSVFQKPLFDPDYQKVRLRYSLLLWIDFQVEQLLHRLR